MSEGGEWIDVMEVAGNCGRCMQRTRMNGGAEQLQDTSKQCKKGGMMGVVLKGGSNQGFPANSRSTAT